MTSSPSVWAIGDIHGQWTHLDALLRALPRSPDDTTVYLGDYIDRGPDSARVVAHVLAEYEAAPERTVLLWGNHEDLAAAYFGLPAPSSYQYDPMDWLNNGGNTTLASYGLSGASWPGMPCPPDLARLFTRLQTYWRPPVREFPDLENVIYVHAGILPGTRPEDSEGDVMLWVREEFLKATDRSGRFVVHGHTPVKALRWETDKIGIDTGAIYGGPLTALQLPERRVYQADASGRVTESVLPVTTNG